LTDKRLAVLKKMKLLFSFTRLPRFARNDIKVGLPRCFARNDIKTRLACRPAPCREAAKYSRILEKINLIFFFSLFSVQVNDLYLRRM